MDTVVPPQKKLQLIKKTSLDFTPNQLKPNWQDFFFHPGYIFFESQIVFPKWQNIIELLSSHMQRFRGLLSIIARR